MPTLTVNDGERVLHEGKILDAGDTFEIGKESAATLVADGTCSEGGKAKAKKADADAPDAPASDAPSGDAKDLIAAIPDYTDEQLAALLTAEEAASKPRKTVVEAAKAEQADRAEPDA
jgi:hypothetical protein